MSRGRKLLVGAAIILAVGGALVTVVRTRVNKKQPLPASITLRGAVIRKDADTYKELPIADAEVTAANGLALRTSKSDSSGLFILPLVKGTRPGQPITLQVRHPEYQPLSLHEIAADKIYVARMVPISHQTPAEPNHPPVVVANVIARYSMKATTVVNIGSKVQAFQVANTGNVPCNGQQPCSPDGRWKAAIASESLDAGQGNEFRNARVSCIAGPCPFTRIESDNFSQGGRTIKVTARNWSDTATFLLEAEVIHPMVSDIVRESYPVIFGQALNFTLPGTAEGVSIQADLNRNTIIFPLGPALLLSWAECNARTNSDHTRVYRCELKPGYRFP
jgi:hypothetical protein